MPADDPWKSIDPPIESIRIGARRIPDVGSHDWGLYWAMDSMRHCLLILQHRSGHPNSRRLPQLRGLRVETLPTEDRSGERLVIRLTDGEQRELFHRFCLDIIDATKRSRSKTEAVERFLVRTWRWHRMLRGGSESRLSPEEQKGLIGELWVLERQLLPAVGAIDAVQAWTGPVGAPKDFQMGKISIEVKTRSPQVPTIRISSEEQLDATGAIRLFLQVIEVSKIPGDPDSVTITDVAWQVYNSIAALDMLAATHFEELLSAAGFDWNDDYSDSLLSIGDVCLYEIHEGFPRITPSICLPGVEDVRYAIALSRCEDFLVDSVVLTRALLGKADGC